jgi:hypothetical protein
MLSMKKLVCIVSFFAVLIAACNKKSSNSETEPGNVDVYAAGYELIGHDNIAKVWKNGIATNLTDGNNSARANAVAVSGPDVYVVGYENDNTGFKYARLWKNGVATTLSDSNAVYAEATAITIAGNDVYIVGQEYTPPISRIVMWKNGIRTVIEESNPNESCKPQSIAVFNGDVYIAGEFSHSAYFWKNGVGTRLSDNRPTSANAVAISGTDVYVVGTEKINGKNIATIWKNGISSFLPNDSTQDAFATSICIARNDVYVAGTQGWVNRGMSKVKLWKNGSEVNFTSENVRIPNGNTSVKVVNNDVYVGGTNGAKPTVWKNGVPESWSDSENYAEIINIFLVSK